jgi:hypothetical protein
MPSSICLKKGSAMVDIKNAEIEISISVNAELERICLESKEIIEGFQRLLGVHSSSEALAKIAVLMREDEAEKLSFEVIRKIRDGEYHYANHPPEPCDCNENAAAAFLRDWCGIYK